MNTKSCPRFWVIVTSKDHVLIGRAGDFCMANHGKKAPLQRMKKGDSVVFYSPQNSLAGKSPCRAFTAFGQVSDDDIYQFDMGNGFVPFRRNVSFDASAHDAPIEPLIETLDFIENKKSWGFKFRFGFFEIGREDFERITDSMCNTMCEK